MKKVKILLIALAVLLVPVISSALVISDVHWHAAGSTSVTITWTSDVTSTTQVSYLPSYTTTWQGTTLVTNLVTLHSAVVNMSLANYYYDFRVYSSGTVSATYRIPCVMNNRITFDGYDTSKAMVTFQAEPEATCFVEYGPTTAYGTSLTPVSMQGQAFLLAGLSGTVNYRFTMSTANGEWISSNSSVAVPVNYSTLNPNQVLVLKNAASAASIEIADYYVAKRNIPTENVITLSGIADFTSSTSISIALYRTLIRDPIKAALDASGGLLRDRIRYIMIPKGMPYAIINTDYVPARTDALDTYLFDPYNEGTTNYFYNRNYRFTSSVVSTVGGNKYHYMISHLEGSTTEICKGLVDKALYGEKYMGPSYGLSWYDAQNNHSPSGFGSYYDVDRAFRTSHAISLAKGYTSYIDNNAAMFGNYPALPSYLPNTIYYEGWHGGLYEDYYEWKVGAFGFNLTSSAAADVRKTSISSVTWVNGELNRGVTAVVGTVNEPYVNGYTVGDVFSAAFLQGYTFAEAGWMSFNWQHWKLLFIGDPIYRLPLVPQVDTDPPIITNVAASGVTNYTDSKWKIYWETDDPCDSTVEWGLTSGYGNTSIIEDGSYNNPKWFMCRHNLTLTGLLPGTTYHYRVKSTDPAGNSTISGDYSFTTTGGVAPAKPTGLAASATDRTVRLTWTANTETDLLGYKIYRSLTTGPGGRSLVATLGKVLVYEDTGLTNGQIYYYVISAYDVAAESVVSNEVNATPNVLTAPTAVSAAAGDGLVNLNWDPVVSPFVVGYNVYRGTISGVYSLLASRTGQTTFYRDTTPVNATTYYYAIRTLSSGESSNSSEVTATPQVGLPTPDLISTVVYQTGSSPSSNYNGVTGTGTSWSGYYNTGWEIGSGYSGTYTIVGTGSGKCEFLLHFDLGNTFNWGQVIEAKLSMRLSSPQPWNFRADLISAQKITDPDNLGSSLANGWGVAVLENSNQKDGATKVYRRQGPSAFESVLWMSGATTVTVNNLDSVILADEGSGTNYTAVGWYDHTVTAAVESFRSAAAPNQGWVLNHTGLAIMALDTEKNGVITNRPKLKVKYKVLTPNLPYVSAYTVSVGTTTATVNWKTDVPTKSQIEYGPTSGYGSSTTTDATLVTIHSQEITGLTPGELYHYRIKADTGSVVGYSSDLTFTTLPGAQTTKMVFDTHTTASSATSNSQIYVMNIDGSDRIKITNDGLADSAPAWSPDGTKIVFLCDAGYPGVRNLYVINSDGTGLMKVTGLTSTYPELREPCFSADGNYLYYVYDDSVGTTGIFRININGTYQTQISSGNDGSIKYPRISPNGAKILFSSSKEAGNQEIYIMNIDGTNIVNLSNNSAEDTEASWSPDGTQIVFKSNRDGNLEIYKMNADGGSQTRLTVTTTRDESFPAWSADESKIVYYRSKLWNETYVKICSMDTDGSNVTGVTPDGLLYVPADSHPSFPLPRIGDYTAPTISSVAAGNIAGTVATITWSTDEVSDSQVEYGITSGVYDFRTAVNSTPVTNHAAGLGSLAETTTYYYRVKSRDVAGNLTVSTEYSFMSASALPVPVLSSVTPSSVLNTVTSTLTIAGTNFNQGTGVSSVSLIGAQNYNLSGLVTTGDIKQEAELNLSLKVKTGVYDIIVTTSIGSSAAGTKVTITTPVPTISSLAPSSCSWNTAATIQVNGGGFFGGWTASDVTAVKLYTSPVTNLGYAVSNNTTITNVVIPAGIDAGVYALKVTTSGGESSGTNFTITAPVPTVSTIVPNSGFKHLSNTIVITGTGFFGGTGTTQVSGILLTGTGTVTLTTYSVASNTQINGVIIPSGITGGAYNVRVSTSGGTSATITGNTYTALTDSTAATVVTATADSSTVRITFDEDMSLSTVTTKANYNIRSPSGSVTPVDLTSATMAYSNKMITIGNLSLVVTNTFTVTVTGVQDLAGNTIVNNGTTNVASGVVSGVDSTPPTACSVLINSGAATANSTIVTLTLSATDSGSGMGSGAQMRFSNDDSNWSTPIAYTSSSTFTLTNIQGVRTVYARFSDAVGNWTASSVTDTITLDTIAPSSCTININSSAILASSTAVTLILSATDSGSSVVSMQLSNTGSTWTTIAYSTSANWILDSAEGTKTVYAKFRDGAGNWTSSAVTDTIRLCTVNYIKVEKVETPSDSALSGESFTLRVSAMLPNDTVSTAYLNTVRFVCSDTSMATISNFTFTGTGTKDFTNIMFLTAGNQTIDAYDMDLAGITGRLTVKVYEGGVVGPAGGTIESGDGTAIEIPAGALINATTIGLNVTLNPSESGIDYKYKNTTLPICRDFGELDRTVIPWRLKEIQFLKPVKIYIPFDDNNAGNIVDKNTLRIFYFNPVTGKYEIVQGTQQVIGSRVMASVDHFSTYRVLGSYLSVDLNGVICYPNPVNLSTAFEKKVKIRNMTPDCVMGIYNIAGELLKTLNEVDFGNQGWILWDGKNEMGEDMPKGVYVYVLTDNAGGKKIGKIAIVR